MRWWKSHSLVRFIKSDRTPYYKNTHHSGFWIILGEPVPHLITCTIRLLPPRTRITVNVIKSWKPTALSHGHNTLTKFENLIQKRLANFKQTWYKASFGEGNSYLFKETQGFTKRDHKILKKGIIVFSSLIECYDIIIPLLKCVYWF